jgi:hypothetical protein
MHESKPSARISESPIDGDRRMLSISAWVLTIEGWGLVVAGLMRETSEERIRSLVGAAGLFLVATMFRWTRDVLGQREGGEQ